MAVGRGDTVDNVHPDEARKQVDPDVDRRPGLLVLDGVVKERGQEDLDLPRDELAARGVRAFADMDTNVARQAGQVRHGGCDERDDRRERGGVSRPAGGQAQQILGGAQHPLGRAEDHIEPATEVAVRAIFGGGAGGGGEQAQGGPQLVVHQRDWVRAEVLHRCSTWLSPECAPKYHLCFVWNVMLGTDEFP